jgi:hypothetical protein
MPNETGKSYLMKKPKSKILLDCPLDPGPGGGRYYYIYSAESCQDHCHLCCCAVGAAFRTFMATTWLSVPL